jgi:hypothetical protein
VTAMYSSLPNKLINAAGSQPDPHSRPCADGISNLIAVARSGAGKAAA